MQQWEFTRETVLHLDYLEMRRLCFIYASTINQKI